MAHIKDFVKREPTLCIALIAALISCILVPIDSHYIGYIDFRTLALLYALMVVVSGLRRAGVFGYLAHRLCEKADSARKIGIILVLLCFFSSMLVTNDVALLTFVPFAVVVLGLAHQEKELVWVVVLQTVAANLGSMLTPVGNPQNLFLFSYYNFTMLGFIKATLPIWLLSLGLILLLCLKLPHAHINIFLGEEPILRVKQLGLYLALFCLCMLVVLRLIGWELMLLMLIIVLLVFDRRRLLQADFMLLATFVCFFVFAGNLARLEPVEKALSALLCGRELFCGMAASQVISNVPAALLLSGFTENGKALLLGVNIGGLGTPVASLASLISMKLYSHSDNASLAAFMKCFLALNFALLIVLALVAIILI